MRKLQQAAVVATMLGSVSLLGAGVAAAGGEEPPEVEQSVACSQDNGDNTQSEVTGLINAGDVSLGGSGDATINQNQQICGIGNTDNQQESGDAESGIGGDGSIGLTVGL